MDVIGLGYDNYLDKKRVIGVLNIDLVSAQNIILEAEEKGFLIDVTSNRARKSVVLTDTNYVFISAKSPNTISKNIGGTGCKKIQEKIA